MPSFFPDPVFGWIFYGVLIGFLGVASYVDFSTIRIPKWLTLGMLAVGIIFSIARCAWLGSVLDGQEDKTVWVLPAHGAALGGLDGLLFALAGFGVCLVTFVGLWFLGLAAGGDVKLIAALGSWVGPKWFLWVLLGSGVAIVILSMISLAVRVIRTGARKALFSHKAKAVRQTAAGAQRRDRLMTYSFPVALSTAIILPLLCRADLHLPLPQPKPASAQASAQP